MRSLVLIGHGSHLNGDSASAVYHYAELIRERGLFHEVIEGYWKEEPSLRQVLKTTASTDITVIPMFISEGYFTETVIPRELGLGHQGPVPPEGIARVIGGRTVRYTLPYGVHPRMTEVILARAREVFAGLNPRDTALIVLGHGTTRNENSNRVIHQNAGALGRSGQFAEVHALFLDEDPRVSSWPELVRSPNVVVVPFFASEGWHTLETIPQDMGLTGTQTVFIRPAGKAQTVYYARPVGTHPAVADVILQLAQEARQQSLTGGDADHSHRAAWKTLRAHAALGMRLGELLITSGSGVYDLRNVLDEGLQGSELRTFVTPEGVRDFVRRDDGGSHRPVRTLRNLPRGWRAVLSEQDLRRGIHAIYPAVVEETYLHACANLRATPWPTTARRQTGIYAKVQKATPEQLEQVTKRLCATCLRTRLWSGHKLSQTFFDGVPGGMPCAEACTFFISEVREQMSVEKSEVVSRSEAGGA